MEEAQVSEVSEAQVSKVMMEEAQVREVTQEAQVRMACH